MKNAIYAPRNADKHKIENDLLLWEIEVISVKRSTYVLFLSFSNASSSQQYYYDLYQCHFEAAAPKKDGKKNARRRLLDLDLKREIASVAQDSQHNE